MKKFIKALLILLMEPLIWIFLIIIPSVILYNAQDDENDFLRVISFILYVSILIIGPFIFILRKNKKRIEEKKKRIEEKKKSLTSKSKEDFRFTQISLI
jgi:hypothetical protein